jgi:hypothetical protein
MRSRAAVGKGGPVGRGSRRPNAFGAPQVRGGAGAAGFLLKDVRRDDLVRAVRVTAAGDSLRAPCVTRRIMHAPAAAPS